MPALIMIGGTKRFFLFGPADMLFLTLLAGRRSSAPDAPFRDGCIMEFRTEVFMIYGQKSLKHLGKLVKRYGKSLLLDRESRLKWSYAIAIGRTLRRYKIPPGTSEDDDRCTKYLYHLGARHVREALVERRVRQRVLACCTDRFCEGLYRELFEHSRLLLKAVHRSVSPKRKRELPNIVFELRALGSFLRREKLSGTILPCCARKVIEYYTVLAHKHSAWREWKFDWNFWLGSLDITKTATTYEFLPPPEWQPEDDAVETDSLTPLDYPAKLTLKSGILYAQLFFMNDVSRLAQVYGFPDPLATP